MRFTDFKNIHAGKKIIVAACGASSFELKETYKNFITLGVNDISSVFDPDYLLILDPKESFAKSVYKGTWQHVENTKAKYIFTILENLEVPEHKRILFEYGERENTNFENGVIGHTANSPYAACLIAAYMGATKIGLIGVDFTENRISGKMRHDLLGTLWKMNAEYENLAKSLCSKGTQLVNLSPVSNITSLKNENLINF
ncbi:MAG TPA: hypothetical protein VNX01_01625 [Bacteroidia bacterium]|jgi:hypothetical protein|nr:hypothetical protein [Bacteroidia bacterium]